MSDTKSREFWIIKEDGYSTWISEKPLYSADTTEEIHVIEFDAYKELKTQVDLFQGIAAARAKENAELKDRVEEYKDAYKTQSIALKMHKEAADKLISELKAKLEGAIKCIEEIKLNHSVPHSQRVTGRRTTDICNEALEELNGRQGATIYPCEKCGTLKELLQRCPGCKTLEEFKI